MAIRNLVSNSNHVPTEERLTLSGASFRYGDGPLVISDVTLSLEPGTTTSIQGRSGSGKSTLISLIGLLRNPTSGEVFASGIPTSQLTDSELSKIRGSHIGFVFQGNHLAQGQPVWKSVAMPLLISGAPRKLSRSKAFEALERVKLGGLGGRLPNELSGGQLQRCAVARAISSDPPILIADEPTGSLDEETADIIATELFSMAGRGAAIVVVTHDRDIANLADRRLMLSRGKLSTLSDSP